jgi:competence protein ComEA
MVRRAVPILIVLIAVAATLVAGDRAPQGVVNINTASAEQLQLLPRVGPSLAERIVSFREANGPFQSTDELTAVKGIGERSLETLRPYLTLSGETTLDTKVKSNRKQEE